MYRNINKKIFVMNLWWKYTAKFSLNISYRENARINEWVYSEITEKWINAFKIGEKSERKSKFY